MNKGKQAYNPGSVTGLVPAVLCLALLAAVTLLSPLRAAASEMIRVERITVEGLVSCSKDELLSLMDIRKGMVAKEKIGEGIKLAFRKGIFEDIVVDYRAGGLLVIEVKEREYIERVTVSGNREVTEKDIKERFLLKEGEVMRYDLVPEAERRLKESLSLVGFPRAAVSVAVEKAPKPYTVNVRVLVKEGPPLIVSRVKIIGSERWLKRRIGVYPGDIYNIEKIRAGMERLREHLKTRGYLNPIVGPFTFSEGVLTVFVSPGKKLEVRFEGNRKMSTSRLLKILPFREAERVDNELIEEASAKILSFYHRSGHIYAQVAPLKREDEETIHLTFFIFEGKAYSIGKIVFENASLSERTLKDVLNLREDDPYNPDGLEDAVEILTGLYQALGYLDVKVEDTIVTVSDETATVDIRFIVTEGPWFHISGITVKGNSFFSDEEVRRIVGVKEGVPYNELDIIDARKRLTDRYKEKGYIDVNVSIETRIEEQSVEVIFRIREGAKVYFGKTVIRGNRFTRTEVIQRELIHREGDPFNYKLLLEGTKRLYRLSLFKDIDVTILDMRDHRRDIVITVSESNPGIVEFSIGYGDYEKMRGSIDVNYRNLWGMNRRIHFRGEWSTLKDRLVLSYHEPYLSGRRLTFNAFILREARTEKSIDTGEIRYRMKKYSSGVSLEKGLRKNLKGQIAYDFSLIETFDVKPDVVLSREDEGSLAISSIRPGVLYDTRDNPFDPSRGVLVGASLKIASTYLLGETDFIKLTFHGSGYKRISRRLILALSLKGGLAQGFADTTDLPIVERFFLGGRNTVRGYEQDTLGPQGEDGTPTGGNAFLMSNVELRNYVGKGFSLVGFVDGGNVWKRASVVDLTLRYTAGLGIRYKTPVGPIRIDYGHKLDKREGESDGEVHFSIGHAF